MTTHGRALGCPASTYTELYLVALAKQGSNSAFERLLGDYENFIDSLAGRYFLFGGETDDLIQHGRAGLWHAIRSFQSTREPSLHGFAELCIAKQIIGSVKHAAMMRHAPLNMAGPLAGSEQIRRRRA